MLALDYFHNAELMKQAYLKIVYIYVASSCIAYISSKRPIGVLKRLIKQALIVTFIDADFWVFA